MHLLARDLHGLDDNEAAVDLGQTPATVIFLSFSDAELGLVAELHEQNAALPSLRCASLARLKHPYSVDLYIDKVARHARLVIVRLLGGKDYWSYGVDELAAAARARGFALAIVPGDTHHDERLERASTLAPDDLSRIWSFFRDGGPDNLRAFLCLASTLAGTPAPWRESEPVPLAGRCETACRPNRPPPHAEEVAKRPSRSTRGSSRRRRVTAPSTCADPASAPRALITFYRSAWLAGDFAPIVALADSLHARGFVVEAWFVASLKDHACEKILAQTLAEFCPDVVLNATAFSARTEGGCVLDRADAPVLQVALATTTRESWESSKRGANGADLAMNVVLPEVDGRIFTRAISFKAQTRTRTASEFDEIRHAPEPSRIDHVAALAQNWARLRRLDNSDKRLALVLSDYPARRGRGGYAIGLDTPQSVLAICDLLRDAGYGIGDHSPVALRSEQNSRLVGREENDRPTAASFETHAARAPQDEGTVALMRALEDGAHCAELPLDDYRRFFAALPDEFTRQVAAAWGAPEDDPALQNGAFRFSCVESGKLVIALQQDRGNRTERRETYHDAELPPRHAYIAFYLFLRHVRNIDALIHLGTHGTLEWLPGKSVMLGPACAPEVLLGPTPLVYPFIVNDPGEAAQAKRRTSAVTIGHMTPPLVEAGLAAEAQEIESLLDEYASAATLDPRRAKLIAEAILDAAERNGLAQECGVTRETDRAEALARLDAWLCDVKEMRVGDGLHVFGAGPCGEAETSGLLRALEGHFVEPGPAGAPSRGRADVLPTGRNLFCIDPRHAPTRTAHDIGARAAREVMMRHAQEHGEWPRNIVLDLWGSATIRTGGEDFAQALALMGVAPLWDHASARVAGFEIEPLAKRDFPRVDVTLHISGLFRDMFPGLIALFHDAVAAVAALDEDEESNPLAAARRESRSLERVFGAAQGSYGLGLSEAIARGETRDALGRAFLEAGGHAFSRNGESAPAHHAFGERVGAADALVHVQDMAETDVLTGAAFAEFEGGFAAANAALGGAAEVVHLDATRPAAPKLRSLDREIARVIRGRAANPRWLEGQMRHGHRGAAEIAETIDNLFAFAATTAFVRDSQWDLVFDATLGAPHVRAFLLRDNPRAAEAIRDVFERAIARGFWRTRRNSVAAALGESPVPDPAPFATLTGTGAEP
ncbi:cobaltochelatase subunit CobN [Methylosinus sp. H3A]|uniref:cobaltochelatase subunit CobN n=1 Tax=Methylosinus sp. H3A TaxID=2785786 RepID=UPI0018C205BD|nr:cobaltochelatase subunit CobN [Methylosinus sp. H3A]MBG0810621.1 cobaltochelatase subunit CobN [Methylosinus sp. H3A]